MTPNDLLADLRDRGAVLTVVAGTLRIDAPENILTDAVCAQLRELKPHLLELLREPEPVRVAVPQPEPPSPLPPHPPAASPVPVVDLAHYADLLAAAESGQLPAGPAPIRPGETAADPARVVLASAQIIRRSENLLWWKGSAQEAIFRVAVEHLDALQRWHRKAIAAGQEPPRG